MVYPTRRLKVVTVKGNKLKAGFTRRDTGVLEVFGGELYFIDLMFTSGFLQETRWAAMLGGMWQLQTKVKPSDT